MPRKPLKRYYLEESEDAGSTYRIVAESSDLEKLRRHGDMLDQEGPIRWAIKDRWLSTIVDLSSHHHVILSELMGETKTRADFEPFVVPKEQVDTYESRKAERQGKIRDIAEDFYGRDK